MTPKAALLCSVGAFAFAFAAPAVAQVVMQPAPVVQPAAPVVTDQPVVLPPAEAAADPVVIPPGAPVHVTVPQTTVNTTVPLTAPFNPAPANTVIETTAGRRVVQAVNGWDVLFDDQGTVHRSHALLTDGLPDQNSIAVRAAAERMWPLTVGKWQTGHSETSDAHAVTYNVLRTENITVPAGAFFTYVVERRDHAPMSGNDAYRTMWYAPSVGAMVKATDGRVPPGVNGGYQVVSMALPYPVANAAAAAAVARRPDTVANQTEYCRERGTTVRLADGRTAVLDCPSYIQADRAGYDNWLIVR